MSRSRFYPRFDLSAGALTPRNDSTCHVRRVTGPVLLGLLAFGMACSGDKTGPDGGDTGFSVENQLNAPIGFLHANECGAGRGDFDLLEGDVIEKGSTETFTVDAGCWELQAITIEDDPARNRTLHAGPFTVAKEKIVTVRFAEPVDGGGGVGGATTGFEVENNLAVAIENVYLTSCGGAPNTTDLLGAQETIASGATRTFEIGAGCYDLTLKTFENPQRNFTLAGMTVTAGQVRNVPVNEGNGGGGGGGGSSQENAHIQLQNNYASQNVQYIYIWSCNAAKDTHNYVPSGQFFGPMSRMTFDVAPGCWNVEFILQPIQSGNEGGTQDFQKTLVADEAWNVGVPIAFPQ